MTNCKTCGQPLTTGTEAQPGRVYRVIDSTNGHYILVTRANHTRVYTYLDDARDTSYAISIIAEDILIDLGTITDWKGVPVT